MKSRNKQNRPFGRFFITNVCRMSQYGSALGGGRKFKRIKNVPFGTFVLVCIVTIVCPFSLAAFFIKTPSFGLITFCDFGRACISGCAGYDGIWWAHGTGICTSTAIGSIITFIAYQAVGVFTRPVFWAIYALYNILCGKNFQLIAFAVFAHRACVARNGMQFVVVC